MTVLSVVSEIPSWDLVRLRDFLSSQIEDDFFEFKEDLIDPTKVRKHFSAFANTRGGIFLWGVNDDRMPVGMDQTANSLTTHVNRCLSNVNLRPTVSFRHLKTIQVRDTRLVHIHHVPPSLNRPHMANERIYVREQGESKALTSGDDVRRLFLNDQFFPEYIAQMDLEMTMLGRRDFQLGLESVIYLRGVKGYLYGRYTELRSDSFKLLLDDFERLMRGFNELERLRAKERSAVVTAPLEDSEQMIARCTELRTAVQKFINDFKRVHQV